MDDTAAAIIAFLKQDASSVDTEGVICAINWILGMQNRDGGWGAFDTGNDHLFLNKIPFSDMNSLCDPSTADVTGRVLEAFGLVTSASKDHDITEIVLKQINNASKRAMEYLILEQNVKGAWYGRWGCNYLYGTSNVLCGFAYYRSMTKFRTMIDLAVTWILEVQNEDGGWGEDLNTYHPPEKAGYGTSTASQTAWAIIGLLAHLPATDKAILAGVSFLIRAQNEVKDGAASWTEAQYTGVGFPKHLYIGYSLYSHYFPMMALGRFCRAKG